MLPKLQKKLAIVCLILLSLTGCTKNTAGSFCLIYEPIFADYENDTPETIKQIDRNNIVFDELCTKNIPYSAE